MHVRERRADAVLIQLAGLGILHGAAAMLLEARANIRDRRLDALDDLIPTPHPRRVIAHEGPQFIDLLLEIVDRHRLTAAALLVAHAGVHVLSRLHCAGVRLPWIWLAHVHRIPSHQTPPARVPDSALPHSVRRPRIVLDVAITSRYLAMTVLLC